MTPLKLKDILVKLLGEKLGTYTTTTKSVYPAIWISPPIVNNSWKVEGLEVTISNFPEVLEIRPLTGEKLKLMNWTVQLVQFDITKSIQPSIDLIEWHFPKTITRVKEQTRDSYEEARVSIYDPRFLGRSGEFL